MWEGKIMDQLIVSNGATLITKNYSVFIGLVRISLEKVKISKFAELNQTVCIFEISDLNHFFESGN